jgi:5,10-methylenetetrahydrofolate reductase
MRTGSLATCKVLKDEGLLPIFQITCRDRNRIALQSDVLSAALLGIENLLLLTGDYTTLGDHPQAKPVFDLDSVSLTHAVKRLEEGFDLAGNEVDGTPPKFAKGAVVSPCSDSVDVQLAKMEAKVKAGTEYFQTQGVYEPEKFFSFIIPKNVGMCRYMNANVAGVHVPDDMIEELKKDKERTKSGDVGVELCAKIIKECKDHCDGVHIMSLGWENRIPEILDLAGVAPVK